MRKSAAEMHREFEVRGFLGQGIVDSIPDLRAENHAWFSLADDLNTALVRTAGPACNVAQVENWNAKAVGVRILLRACASMQAALLMTERGMVAPGRLLVRSLIEDAFCVAALHDKPDQFIEVLKEDFHASQRLQAKFLLAENMIETGVPRDELQAVMDALGKPSTMSPKAVAAMGPLTKQYLAYQRLSDDSAHTSARSLNKHLVANADRTSWMYTWGAGSKEENAATLYHAILAGIPIGVAITQMLELPDHNSEFAKLAERLSGMPTTAVI